MPLTWGKSRRGIVKVSFPADRGAICFDFGMHPPLLSPPELISSGISWFWTSSRSGDNWDKSPVPGLPEARPLTRLYTNNSQMLVDDFRDDNKYQGREIVIIGLAPESEQIVQREKDWLDAMQSFAGEGIGPIQIIIHQEDDGDALLFATWPLSQQLRSLIASWLVQTDNIREVHYVGWKKWQTKLLEAMIGLIVSPNKS